VRAAIHLLNKQQQPAEQWGAGGASFGLRMMPTGQCVDRSPAFNEGRPYQTLMALHCARFIDCQTDYTPRCVSLLQRCLASNSTQERTAFFHEMRACRRRPQTAVQVYIVRGSVCLSTSCFLL